MEHCAPLKCLASSEARVWRAAMLPHGQCLFLRISENVRLVNMVETYDPIGVGH